MLAGESFEQLALQRRRGFNLALLTRQRLQARSQRALGTQTRRAARAESGVLQRLVLRVNV
jgi:hypothetical protein